MEVKRAKEIVHSLGVINVTYKNRSVWIENIQEKNGTANVRVLDEDSIISTEISQLDEG